MESDLGVVVLPGTPNYQLKSINLQQTWVTETLAFTDSTLVFHPASLGQPDFCAKDVLILHTISNRHAFVVSVESGRSMEAFQFSCDSSPRRITDTMHGWETCEIWDCNCTSQPMREVQLGSGVDSVLGHAGFLLRCHRGETVSVTESSSGVEVLQLHSMPVCVKLEIRRVFSFLL
ncbi:hypothetical protein Pelo_19530 [Pelomyxa schiedti]|nr:hypothetical protein Pelo_19530 [Pelomyxa schiedti]